MSERCLGRGPAEAPREIAPGIEMAATALPEIKLFRCRRGEDARGYVQPVFNEAAFAAADLDFRVIHENHCLSPKRGTVRGFHFQLPPKGQPKLIRVTRGRMLDVNVDLRASSPTYGHHVAAELTPEGWNQILVPSGFAHCYATLAPDTEVIFRLGADFAPDHLGGLAWNDPGLGIDWGLTDEEAIVLPRDLARPPFRDLAPPFP